MIQANSPDERAKLSGCYVLPTRSISGRKMVTKGTFGIEVNGSGAGEQLRSVHVNMVY